MIKLCAFSDEAASDLRDQAAALQKHRIGYTELRSISGKNVADFTNAEAAEYKRVLDGEGIAVWSIGSPLGKVDIDVDFSEYQNVVRRVMELACRFETTRVRAFSFFRAYDRESEVIDRLQKMVEIAEEYGVSLCHENEKEIFGDVAERVETLLTKVSGLKFVYDPANFLQCGEPAEKTLQKLHGKAEYFHIKDVVAKTGELVPAGYGDGKIGELVEKITSDKVLTLEPHLAIFDAYKSIDNAEMKHKFSYASGGEAFDAAVAALKAVLEKTGYVERNGGYEKCK